MLGILSYTAGGNVIWIVFTEGNLAQKMYTLSDKNSTSWDLSFKKVRKTYKDIYTFFIIVKKPQKEELFKLWYIQNNMQ